MIVSGMTRKAAAAEATRERLMTATLSLVAENGFEGTSVGAIEQYAGLAPRSGALYQYFEGKDHALRAAIERELAVMDELGSVIDMLPLGDLRAELTLMARWNLASLDRRSQLASLLRREARRLPSDILNEIYTRIVERPYKQIVQWLRERFDATGKPPPDLYALALVLTEAMSSYRFMQDTFGRVPDGIDDERLIAAWVDTALAVAARHGLEPQPAQPRS
jgi:AcrR family transcriptional regulator